MNALALVLGAWLGWAPPAHAGCATAASAAPGGPTIQAAVNAAPGMLVGGDHCVTLAPGAYFETVTVVNIEPNGHRIVIAGSTAAAKPVIVPPMASFAAFTVLNSSVSLEHLEIRASSGGITHAVRVSSSGVLISSVTIDVGANIGASALYLGSERARVVATSITVSNAPAIDAPGTLNDIWRSTLAVSGGSPAAWVAGGPFNRARDSLISHAASTAVWITAGAAGTVVERSTVASSAGPALLVSVSSGHEIAASYLRAASGAAARVEGPAVRVTSSRLHGDAGRGLWLTAGSYESSVSGSTITASGPLPALAVDSASRAVVADSFVFGAALGASLQAGADHTVLRQSTIASAGTGLELVDHSSSLVHGVYAQGAVNAVTVSGAVGAAVFDSRLYGGSGAGLELRGASLNLAVAGSTFSAANRALFLRADSRGEIALASAVFRNAPLGLLIEGVDPTASISLSSAIFEGLAPGATAVQLVTGVLVATFSFAAFSDASTAVNVDAAGLLAGSRLTMRAARGPRAGPLFENDPGGRVDWPELFDTPAAPTGFAGVAVSTRAILWTWTDHSANESGYRVRAGTANLSGDLPPNTTFWLQTGLLPNSTVGPLHAQAFNSSGTADSAAVTRYSWAAIPSTITFTLVTSTAIALVWSDDGNPAGTVYELQRSTSGFVSLSTLTVLGYSEGGLAHSTTHHYRLRAFNFDGIVSTFSVTVSTRTRPAAAAPPLAPTDLAGTAAGTGSILWTWTDNAFDEDGYRVLSGSESLSGNLAPNTASWLQTGLSANQPSGPLTVQAFNSSGPANSAPLTRFTLAFPPAGLAASGVQATSASFSWSLNGNPAGTTAELQRSTDNASFVTLFALPLSSFTDTSLLGCTSYYFRVRHRNGDGLPTGFDAAVNFLTLNTTPSAAGFFIAEPAPGSRVSFSWGPSPTEGVVGYRLYGDGGTGTVDFGAPLAVLASTETGFTTGVLVSSPSYRFVLRARHRCGVEDPVGASAISGAAAAPASVRAVIREPQSARRVHGDRVTVLAELAAGSPSAAASVRFQFRPSGAGAWADIAAAEAAHPNPDTAYPYFVHWNVTGLAPGDYDLRAVATAAGGGADPAPAAVTVTVDPVAPEIAESLQGGLVRKDRAVSNSVGATVSTAGTAAESALVRVELPAGALASSSATLRLLPGAALSSAPPSGQTALASLAVTLTNGETQLQNGKTAALSFFYPSRIVATERLAIWAFDEASGQWRREAPSVVDASSRVITAQTSHFSQFALFESVSVASADLSAVRVYPNPYKPNSGGDDDGKPFSHADPNSGIIFDRLPAEVTIRVYTLSGRLVAELSRSGGDGTVRWDARNRDGRDAASGAYIAVISAPGHRRVVKKLVILR